MTMYQSPFTPTGPRSPGTEETLPYGMGPNDMGMGPAGTEHTVPYGAPVPPPAQPLQPVPTYGPAPAQGFAPAQPPLMPAPRSNSNRLVVIVLVIVAVVALAAGGFWFYTTQIKPGPQPTPTAVPTQPTQTQPTQPTGTQPTQPTGTQPTPQPTQPKPTNNNQNSTGKFAESDQFMRYMIAGDAAAAWAMIGPDMQAEEDEAQFTDELKSMDYMSSCHMNWTSETESTTDEGLPSKEDIGTMTCSALGDDATLTLTLTWAKYSGGNYLLYSLDAE